MNKENRRKAKHLTFDNEENILSFFRDYKGKFQIACSPELSSDVERVLKLLHSEEYMSSWTNNAKTGGAPDFYNEKYRLMLEFMRTDDKHPKKNPVLAMESKMVEEFVDIADISQIGKIMTVATTDLPLDKDHNFKWYRENFVRVVNKHSKKIDKYKKNFRGFKLIFFIFDETSGVYMKKLNDSHKSEAYDYLGEIHQHWVDSALLSAIKISGADFFVWFKPWNSFLAEDGMKDDLSQVVVYDVKNVDLLGIDYAEHDMLALNYRPFHHPKRRKTDLLVEISVGQNSTSIIEINY